MNNRLFIQCLGLLFLLHSCKKEDKKSDLTDPLVVETDTPSYQYLPYCSLNSAIKNHDGSIDFFAGCPYPNRNSAFIHFVDKNNITITDQSDKPKGSLVVIANGDHYMVSTQNNWPDNQLVLSKISNTGDTIWTKSYSGYHPLSYPINTIGTADGQIAMAFTQYDNSKSESDIFIVKLSSSGELLFSKQIAIEHDQCIYDLIESKDGGFVLTGGTYYEPNPDMLDHLGTVLTVKTTDQGVFEWASQSGYEPYRGGNKIMELNDGNYLVAGTQHYPQTRLVLSKISTGGNTLWFKTFTDSTYYGVRIGSIDAQGNIVVVGNNYEPTPKSTILKFNLDGDILAKKYFNGASIDAIFPDLSSGSYLLFGHKNNQLFSTTLGADWKFMH